MRHPLIIVQGWPIGPHGVEMLTHVITSLRRLAAAVDAFEEAYTQAIHAHDAARLCSGGANELTGPAAIVFEEFLRREQYWLNRAEIAAKAAVLEADQMMEGLKAASRDDQRLATVVAAGEAAHPDLTGMRDAVAHLDARRRWRFDRRKGSLPDRGGVTLTSDLFLWQGRVESDRYLLPLPGPGDVVRPGVFLMTDATVAAFTDLADQMARAVAAAHIDPRPW